ncbi:lipopolysaccharide-induced tumor necrosis factor-alpha factor homolog [Bradysia coprophila]|uniref:lipopolysaccharide-induced tumor necrosis factor-alpha factor homolog n=1 Tax=Bradysia coprophila TaxID=38358 RepID=UPI00187DD754|nr:lipopolysaccharide-induced tumor necrosis factor-alpha factor homolog [Bradysia coprophila]
MQQQPTTVIIAGPQVGPESTMVTCPSCRASVRTQVRHESTTKTHLIALLLCVCFCWPCICVPYCVDSCKNANHYCPSCGSFIGSYTN